MEKVIVKDLVKTFGSFLAVDSISFSIKDNEFFSLLGPSGCGKSTTLRCIAGLEVPNSGMIAIGEQEVFSKQVNISPNKRSIGMVFQNYAIWPHMSVMQNIGYPLKVAGLPKKEIHNKVMEVIHLLDMAGLEKRKPHQLSGGQQQRVALGRSLVMNPEVLLLDEPLSNLDAKLREVMRIELKKLQKSTGIPILYVTHDQLEAMALSDRVAIMADGKIIQCAPPNEIYTKPANQFVFDFVGQANYIDCSLLEERGERLSLKIGEKTIEIDRPHSIPEKGADLVLGVRPEDIILEKGLNGEGLVGEIHLVLYLGQVIEYQIQVGGQSLRAHLDKYTSFQIGDPVHLKFKQITLWDKRDKKP